MTILHFNLLAPFCRGKHVSKQNKVTFLELFSSSPSSWWLKQLATWFVWIIYLVLFKRTHFKKKRAHRNKKLDPNLPAKKSWRDFKCPTIPILNRKNTTIPGDHYRSSKVSQGVPPKIHQVIARFFYLPIQRSPKSLQMYPVLWHKAWMIWDHQRTWPQATDFPISPPGGDLVTLFWKEWKPWHLKRFGDQKNSGIEPSPGDLEKLTCFHKGLWQ